MPPAGGRATRMPAGLPRRPLRAGRRERSDRRGAPRVAGVTDPVLFLVPARAGSRRVPGKNLRARCRDPARRTCDPDGPACRRRAGWRAAPVPARAQPRRCRSRRRSAKDARTWSPIPPRGGRRSTSSARASAPRAAVCSSWTTSGARWSRNGIGCSRTSRRSTGAGSPTASSTWWRSSIWRAQARSWSWSTSYPARAGSRPTTCTSRSARGQIRVETAAAVEQATGEDWTDVTLLLSTAMPGRGIDLPELLTWTLGERSEFVPQLRPRRAPPAEPPLPAPALPAARRGRAGAGRRD